jgi:hypothetical protein
MRNQVDTSKIFLATSAPYDVTKILRLLAFDVEAG